MSRQQDAGHDAVSGERSAANIDFAHSVQSRMSSLLAAGLMIALGVGALSWYYSNALRRQHKARDAALAQSTKGAQGEMALPPLGKVDVAPVAPPAPQLPDPLAPPVGALPESVIAAAPVQPDRSVAPVQRTATERRLAGATFARDSSPMPASAAVNGELSEPDAMGLPAVRPGPTPQPAGSRGEAGLTTLLKPTEMAPALAHALPTQRLLLAKGAFIDCTLETAIDSTLPGMTTCVTATDTFGIDGQVVLLERGSKLIGETRGEVQNGSARVFVLWTEARTPTGVRVPLDSPGTDELGRSGLRGEVNRHFWDRFGAALLISVIDGGMQAAVQAENRSNSAVVYNPSTSQDAVTEVLKGSINVAPSVVIHQGDRVQILVARDLDFREVYELHATAR